MAQEAPFIKLKEQIEAAKRGLTEMSNADVDNRLNNPGPASPLHDFSASASPKIVEIETIKANLGVVSCSDTVSTKMVDMTPKTVLSETLFVDHALGNTTGEGAGDFQFFHRAKQPKGSDGLALGASLEDAGSVDFEAEALLFKRLGGRLATLEGGVEQNRKYILELINLLSQLNLRQESANRKAKPSQRLNRRYAFWLVIGFLVVGWFCLTPSGHIAVQHFLTFL
jgi:hypothetical protein